MLSKIDEFFPLREKKIANDDQPFMTEKLKHLKRKKCRIYRKQRRSDEWNRLEEIYRRELKIAKNNFYRENTSLAAPGALANRLQRRTTRKANEANLDSPNQISVITSL